LVTARSQLSGTHWLEIQKMAFAKGQRRARLGSEAGVPAGRIWFADVFYGAHEVILNFGIFYVQMWLSIFIKEEI
jgi:hypothetical protein